MVFKKNLDFTNFTNYFNFINNMVDFHKQVTINTHIKPGNNEFKQYTDLSVITNHFLNIFYH